MVDKVTYYACKCKYYDGGVILCGTCLSRMMKLTKLLKHTELIKLHTLQKLSVGLIQNSKK